MHVCFIHTCLRLICICFMFTCKTSMYNTCWYFALTVLRSIYCLCYSILTSKSNAFIHCRFRDLILSYQVDDRNSIMYYLKYTFDSLANSQVSCLLANLMQYCTCVPFGVQIECFSKQDADDSPTYRIGTVITGSTFWHPVWVWLPGSLLHSECTLLSNHYRSAVNLHAGEQPENTRTCLYNCRVVSIWKKAYRPIPIWGQFISADTGTDTDMIFFYIKKKMPVTFVSVWRWNKCRVFAFTVGN